MVQPKESSPAGGFAVRSTEARSPLGEEHFQLVAVERVESGLKVQRQREVASGLRSGGADAAVAERAVAAST